MDDITRYGIYLTKERHASKNTVSSYLRDVTQFSEYLRGAQSCSLREADREMVQNYMTWMQGRGKSASSATRFLASVKSFYNYLIACGDMVVNALDASEELEKRGINACVINMHTLKPLDEAAVVRAAGATRGIITVETHNKIGGLGAAVAQVVVEKCPGTPMKFLGI